MAENDKSSEPAAPAPPAEGAPPTPPKRSPGHRGADVKDTVAEMAAKAHEISLEAGSKMAAAMKDVVNAAAGLSGFVIESARDLVQYMVRRGQMTQEEADKLIRQVEEHQPKRKPVTPLPAAQKQSEAAHSSRPPTGPAPSPVHLAPSGGSGGSTQKPATRIPLKPATKQAAPARPAKTAVKKASPSAKKPAVKKPAAKKPAAKKPAARKPAPRKPAPRPAAKKGKAKSKGR
ncbi:MAG TPA: hypothetical protein VHM24_11945 [Gemmatimonadaceae bacterium]|nr:hypothetical protein [Gemmatimonadaceae bacterium]